MAIASLRWFFCNVYALLLAIFQYLLAGITNNPQRWLSYLITIANTFELKCQIWVEP